MGDVCGDMCDSCDQSLARPVSHNLGSHLSSTHNTVIPQITLSTTTDVVTTGCHSNSEQYTENTCVDNDYHVSGNLRTHKYDCVQECQCDDDCFEVCSDSHSTINRCGHEHQNEQIGTPSSNNAGECNCQNFDGEVVDAADPDEDISERVGKSVEATIGDVLSGIINRCISSSLKSCITIE